MPRPANLDNPIYDDLTAHEMAAIRRDYLRDCAAAPSAVADLVKRNGLAAYAVGWLGSYRTHQGKRRRARWPDEGRRRETGAEVRARKTAARARRLPLA